MDSSIRTIVEQLQSLIKQTQSMQTIFIQEIIALEKITNYTHKSIKLTAMVVGSKQNKKVVEKQKEVPEINVQEKINQLINHMETKQKIIESNIKPVVEVKVPEVVVEKKPPLPVLNTKITKNVRQNAPVYVPPRNQNEVTGKVTQTVLRTSAAKIFKPQKVMVAKKSESKEKVKQKEIKGSVQKVEKQESKMAPKIEVKETKIIEKQVAKNTSLKSQIKSEVKPNNTSVVDKKKQAQPIKKIETIVNFHKSFQQILQSLIGNNQANHKPHLKKLLSQCQNQQKGYKMHEQTNRYNFIKKVNNYYLSKQKVNDFTSHQIIRKKWNYHNELLIYQQLLHNLDKEITNLQQLKDCRIDPKQQYRMKKSVQTYSNRIDEIIEESKSVPDKIELQFQYTPVNLNSKSNQITNQMSFENINEIKVHDELLRLLEELAEKGSLQRKEMRCLQVLSQISIFKSKRCPNIIMSKDYQKWKEFYQV